MAEEQFEHFESAVERIVYDGAKPVIHQAEDGTLTIEWYGDPRQTIVSRPLVEEWIEEHNELVRCRKRLRGVKDALQKERFWWTFASPPAIVTIIEKVLDAD